MYKRLIIFFESLNRTRAGDFDSRAWFTNRSLKDMRLHDVQYLSRVICFCTAFLLDAALICGCSSLCLSYRTERQQRRYENFVGVQIIGLYSRYFMLEYVNVSLSRNNALTMSGLFTSLVHPLENRQKGKTKI